MCSVRRRPHLISLTSFSLAWGLLVFMLVLPFTVSAAGVTYQTTRVGPASYVTNGITSPITVNVAPAGDIPKYQQIRPIASPSTLGKLARSAARGGIAGVAIGAAVEGLGYLIDQATGDIFVLEPVYNFPPGNVVGINTVSGGGCYDPDAYSDRQYRIFTPKSGSCSDGKVSVDIYAWDCPAGTSSSNVWEYRGRCWPIGTDLSPDFVNRPATQAETAQADNVIGNSLSLSNASQVLMYVVSDASPRGSVDTSQYPVTLTSNNSDIQTLFNTWPELRIAYQNMLNAELAALIAASDPNFQPSPDEQVIIDSGSELPPLSPVSGDLPAFCEWASWLCEPFVGGDQPDVPMLDLESPDYDSGLPTSGTCPEPYTFETVFSGPMSISFQPACDLASAIKMPLLAMSYLMAGFIVVGVRR